MRSTGQLPLVRISVSFALGIVLFIHLGNAVYLGSVFYVAMFLVIAVKILRVDASWKHRWIPGVILYVAIILGGNLWAELHYSVDDALRFYREYQSDQSRAWVIKVLSDPKPGKQSVRAICKLLYQTGRSNYSTQDRFRCLVYFGLDSCHSPPGVGDYLIARLDLRPIDPPGNPNEFDFSTYMARKNVGLKSYMRPGEWKVVGNGSNFLVDFAGLCKDYISSRLKLAGVEGQEFGLAASLLLGDKDDLEKDLRDSFSAAGAMHILCVSGLHVGIIFAILNLLLKGLSRWRHGKIIQFILVALTIWTYALITGLSPSVTRASLMFSLLQTGKLMRNPPPVTNNLAASALILMFINPLVITSIGFQFSYLAVFAIVHIIEFQPLIWNPSNPLIKKIWSLIMVSFAAQVGTGPLALHYFHLFPVWFLLTNMIVIPLASVILYLAMATIFIPIQLFYGLTGFLLSLSLKLLATSVEFIESLPASVITSIYLSGWETLLVYALSLSLYQLLCLRSKKMLLLSLVLMITFLAMQNIGLWNAESQKQIYVYDISGHTVIELYERRSSITMYNQDEVPVSAIEYTVLPNRIAHKIKESKTVRLYNERVESECGFMTVKGFVLFAGRRIFIAEENFREADSARCDMDIVVITGNFKYEAGGLVKQFSPELLIIDSSVPYWRQKEIEDECLGLGIRSYSVRQNGCYIEEI